MMLNQSQLKKMLDNMLPRRWCLYDWRKVGGKIVKFVIWNTRH